MTVKDTSNKSLTVKESLTSVYPIPDAVLASMAIMRKVDCSVDATAEILNSKEYRLFEADIKAWRATAPDVSQSGVSFNLTDNARKELKKDANAVYKEFKDAKYSGVNYGYKGSRI